MTACPAGYVRVEVAGADVVCLAACEAAVREALAGGSLHAWAAAHPARRELRGRAAAYAVPLAGDCADVVVRHSWHGGLLAPLTRDLFLPPTRAPRELDVSLRLAGAGVRTPQVVAYVVYPAGPLFRRADVATRLVAGGRDLAAAIAERDGETVVDALGAPARLAPWLRPTAALLHALAAAGARHPDLNLKNVLLAPAAGAGATAGAHDAWVLDVDVVRLVAGPVRTGAAWAAGEANFDRLARSLRKWRDQRGLAVSDLELDLLHQLARRGPDAEVAVRWRPRNSAAHVS